MKTTSPQQKTSLRKKTPVQRAASAGPDGMAVASSQNRTGLPDALKSGVESLSGLSLDDVRVHYNSPKPATLDALAYAQGTDIHVAPGQERHLPHEAWHIVQQAQGRVKPTMQMKDDVPVNNDRGLELEADLMGTKALGNTLQRKAGPSAAKPLQGKFQPVQFVLRVDNETNRRENARLTGLYHAAEESGDALSIETGSIVDQRSAITFYNRAINLRRQAAGLHIDNGGGHLTAITTLEDKITARNARIRALTPAPPRAPGTGVGARARRRARAAARA